MLVDAVSAVHGGPVAFMNEAATILSRIRREGHVAGSYDIESRVRALETRVHDLTERYVWLPGGERTLACSRQVRTVT